MTVPTAENGRRQLPKIPIHAPLLLWLLIPVIVLLAPPVANSAVKAFPSAEGFGSDAVGGRGGSVHHVTNLDDSGSGSLRACVEADGPRTCIFRVGGTIMLQESLVAANPYLTIAGQTAPGDGIALRLDASAKRAALLIKTHDVVVRQMRVRVGPSETPTCCRDAIAIVERARDVILDHVSASWAVDENVSVSGEGVENVTIQWSIVSESLNCSSHKKGCHGMGVLVGQGATDVSLHHNLIAHNQNRSPRIAGGSVDVVNNVIYNPGNWNGASHASENAKVNYVGNHVISGPNTSPRGYFIKGDAQIYLESNTMDLRFGGNADLVRRSGNERVLSEPHAFPHVTTFRGDEVYARVLEGAGAILPSRDPVDDRIVATVRMSTGAIIDSPSEVGGWPELRDGSPYPDGDADGISDDWELAHGLDPGDPLDQSEVTQSGYTYLETFLNEIGDTRGHD